MLDCGEKESLSRIAVASARNNYSTYIPIYCHTRPRLLLSDSLSLVSALHCMDAALHIRLAMIAYTSGNRSPPGKQIPRTSSETAQQGRSVSDGGGDRYTY